MNFCMLLHMRIRAFSKPNLNYYRHLLKTLDKDAEDCLMVGNDVDEDMCAFKIGMDDFYLMNV